jgi:hypothetical protein
VIWNGGIQAAIRFLYLSSKETETPPLQPTCSVPWS